MKHSNTFSSILGLSLIVSFFAIVSPASLKASSEDRDVVVDTALGNLEAGSRIAAPGSYEGSGANPKVPGSSTLSPSMDTGAARKVSGPGPAAHSGTRSNAPTETTSHAGGGGPVKETPAPASNDHAEKNTAPAETTSGTGPPPSEETHAPASPPPSNDHTAEPVTEHVAEEPVTDQAEKNTAPAETTSGTEPPLSEETHTPVDTGTQAAEENPSPPPVNEPTEPVIEHVPEEPVAGEATTGETTVGTGDGATEETPAPAGNDQEALIDVDAGVNTNAESPSDTVEADVNINPESEDIHVGADVAGGSPIGVEENGGIVDVATEAETSTDQTLIEDTILNEPVTEIPPPSPEMDLGAEIDASGETVSGEAEVGVEADIDGSNAGDDVADDAADGLSAPPVPSI